MGNHQFLGYWGYGSPRELDALLNTVVSTDTNPVSLDDRLDLLWKVAFVGAPAIAGKISTSVSEIADFSVSGLTKDVWVKLEDDNLVLGREPFGRSPLYWCCQGQVIWFASRLQLLLPVLELPQINVAGLYGYSCFSYVPTPLTPVNGVFTVPAGTELIWHGDCEGIISPPKSRRIHEWCESTSQITDEATAITELQTLLKEAIHSQIADLNDEPVGVFLSGGLDSSVVAALLVQAGVKVRAYSLDFGISGSEYPYAEQVAQFLNIPLVRVPATPREIQKALIPTVQALDLPFGDGVTTSLYLLSQAASQETRIIFNGEGGDQLFAGWTNKPLIAAGVYQTEHPCGQETFTQQYLRTFHRLWGYEAAIYPPEVRAQIQNLHPEDWLEEALDPAFSSGFMHRLRRASLMLKGAQNIHPRATNLGIAHGLSVRSPFCDLAMTEWTFGLSGELFLQGSCEKYILKRAVEGWLPSEIIWRQKRGMGVPLNSWCLNEFWHQLGTWLNPGTLRAENCFIPHIATQIIEGKLGASIQGRRIGESLWLLIMWQLWRSHVFGAGASKQSWDHPFWLSRNLWRQYKRWQA